MATTETLTSTKSFPEEQGGDEDEDASEQPGLEEEPQLPLMKHHSSDSLPRRIVETP